VTLTGCTSLYSRFSLRHLTGCMHFVARGARASPHLPTANFAYITLDAIGFTFFLKYRSRLMKYDNEKISDWPIFKFLPIILTAIISLLSKDIYDSIKNNNYCHLSYKIFVLCIILIITFIFFRFVYNKDKEQKKYSSIGQDFSNSLIAELNKIKDEIINHSNIQKYEQN
jgi:hypothetical protein